MKHTKKKLLSLVMVAMLSLSAAALPQTASDTAYAPFTAYASAGYANAQMESYARQVAAIVNRERAAKGLAPLRYSVRLSEAALVRAEEIQSVFSHTRPNGTRCFTAVTEAGIRYRSVGENIAYGQRTPEEVMQSWMNSSGHRANILGEYDYIGVGVTYKNGAYYWSQFFAISDDLSGEVITLGNESATPSTTQGTSQATASTSKSTSQATASTTKPTSQATASTTKPTSQATASASKPTSQATAPTSKPTSQATKPTSQATASATKAVDSCGKKASLIKMLLLLIGGKNEK